MTSGPTSYTTLAVLGGLPIASERGRKWELGMMTASSLPYGGSPMLHNRGTKSEVAHTWA